MSRLMDVFADFTFSEKVWTKPHTFKLVTSLAPYSRGTLLEKVLKLLNILMLYSIQWLEEEMSQINVDDIVKVNYFM